jgi:hypothetical protein
MVNLSSCGNELLLYTIRRPPTSIVKIVLNELNVHSIRLNENQVDIQSYDSGGRFVFIEMNSVFSGCGYLCEMFQLTGF